MRGGAPPELREPLVASAVEPVELVAERVLLVVVLVGLLGRVGRARGRTGRPCTRSSRRLTWPWPCRRGPAPWARPVRTPPPRQQGRRTRAPPPGRPHREIFSTSRARSSGGKRPAPTNDIACRR